MSPGSSACFFSFGFAQAGPSAALLAKVSKTLRRSATSWRAKPSAWRKQARKRTSSSKSRAVFLSLSTTARASAIIAWRGMKPRPVISSLSSSRSISPLPSSSYVSNTTLNWALSNGMYFSMKRRNSSKSTYSYSVTSLTMGMTCSSAVITWPR